MKLNPLDNWDRLRAYLKRRHHNKGYCHRIVGSNVVQWADFWKENKNELTDQITAILVEHTENKERVIMTPKEEYWFRQGLSKLPALWEACIAEKHLEDKSKD